MKSVRHQIKLVRTFDNVVNVNHKRGTSLMEQRGLAQYSPQLHILYITFKTILPARTKGSTTYISNFGIVGSRNVLPPILYFRILLYR
jgi:hypothetical protein